jgi:hypothetical protein
MHVALRDEGVGQKNAHAEDGGLIIEACALMLRASPEATRRLLREEGSLVRQAEAWLASGSAA